MHRIAFTGGPGSGKSTLLEYLAQQGVAVVTESARRIIQTRKCAGLAARPSPVEFAEQIMQCDIDKYEAATAAITLFDRSLIDALYMLDTASALAPQRRAELLERYPYHPVAFILPPWREIYRQDDERDQTFGEAMQVYNALAACYRGCGYRLIEVPCLPVVQRAQFVIRVLRSQGLL